MRHVVRWRPRCVRDEKTENTDETDGERAKEREVRSPEHNTNAPSLRPSCRRDTARAGQPRTARDVRGAYYYNIIVCLPTRFVDRMRDHTVGEGEEGGLITTKKNCVKTDRENKNV